VNDSSESNRQSDAGSAERGSLWSLIAGLLLFAAIVASVWYYIYPRLSGEIISGTARVAVYAAGDAPRDNWRPITVLTGHKLYIAAEPLLTTEQLTTFRGSYAVDASGKPVPLLELRLSASGAALLNQYLTEHPKTQLAVLINERPMAAAGQQSPDADKITFELTNVSEADAEDAFARLTQ
jgi:hypothetical protein